MSDLKAMTNEELIMSARLAASMIGVVPHRDEAVKDLLTTLADRLERLVRVEEEPNKPQRTEDHNRENHR